MNFSSVNLRLFTLRVVHSKNRHTLRQRIYRTLGTNTQTGRPKVLMTVSQTLPYTSKFGAKNLNLGLTGLSSNWTVSSVSCLELERQEADHNGERYTGRVDVNQELSTVDVEVTRRGFRQTDSNKKTLVHPSLLPESVLGVVFYLSSNHLFIRCKERGSVFLSPNIEWVRESLWYCSSSRTTGGPSGE